QSVKQTCNLLVAACRLSCPQRLRPVLPVSEDQHRSVDRLPLPGTRRHGRQLPGLLHHPLH
ncbi:hypothetical protein LDENG_00228080, partial [Lucifuga dentata]